MKTANPFRFQLMQPTGGKSGVLKLWFGSSRYVIIKAKSMIAGVKTFSVELDRRMRLGAKPDSIYHKVVNYVHRGRVTVFRVEILLESEDPLELLQREHTELMAGSADKNCLNNSFEAMIPQWITQDVVTQFNNWKNPKPTKKRNVRAKKATATQPKDAKAVPAGRGRRKPGSVPDAERGDTGVGRKTPRTRAVKKEPEGDHHE